MSPIDALRATLAALSARLAALARAREGSVAIEAAAGTVFLLLAAGAALDAARFIQTTARVDRYSATLADLVARADELRDREDFDAATLNTDIGAFFEMARLMALPEDIEEGGGVVFASITSGGAGAHQVNWVRSIGDNVDTDPARFAAYPALPDGVTFIIAEVVMPFDAFILDNRALPFAVGFDPVVTRRAVFRPRRSALASLAPSS